MTPLKNEHWAWDSSVSACFCDTHDRKELWYFQSQYFYSFSELSWLRHLGVTTTVCTEYRATPTHKFDLVVTIIARHFRRFTFNFFRLFSISILSLTASSPVSLSRTSSGTFIWLRPFLVSSEQSSIFSLAFIVQGIIVFQKHSLSQGRARWCSTCAWRRTSTRENTWIWGRSWKGGRQGTLSGGVRRAQSRHHTLALLHLYHLVLQSCPSFAS